MGPKPRRDNHHMKYVYHTGVFELFLLNYTRSNDPHGIVHPGYAIPVREKGAKIAAQTIQHSLLTLFYVYEYQKPLLTLSNSVIDCQ